MTLSKFFFLFVAGLLITLAVILIALPCVTHRVQLVNMHTYGISFRLSLRDKELWTGMLEPGGKHYLPVVTDKGGGHLTLEATAADGSKIGAASLYVLAYPKDISTNLFIITDNRVGSFYVTHSLLTPFKSETILVPLSGLLVATNLLRCLDCSKVRLR